jgi:ABC-type nitrate/sulfonate/bicarbonate transport system permease component
VGVIVGEFIGARRGFGKITIETEATRQIAVSAADLMVSDQ